MYEINCCYFIHDEIQIIIAACSYFDVTSRTYNVGDLWLASVTPVCGVCTCKSDGTVECLANGDCDLVI